MLAFVAAGASPGELLAQVGTYLSNADRYLLHAELAQRDNDCAIFLHYLSLAQEQSESAFSGLSDGERREVARKVAEFKRIGCPPKREAETGLRTPGACDTAVQVGAGPSVIQGVDVANGGFRTNHNVAGPKFEGTLRAPLGGCLRGGWIFEARGFGFDGDSSKNLSGSGTTFIQANGGTQPVAIAGPISSGRNEVGITQFGGEIKFKLDSPPVTPAPFQQTFQFTPFFGAGFEHIKVETRTSANWDPIAFFVTDVRETETNRVFLFAGGEIDILNTPDGFKLFTFARGQLNLDFVEGSAFYHTAQAGIFNEFLEHHFRKTTFTVGGEVGFGASKTFAGGATAGVKVGVGALPIHRLEFHLGAPATLESEHRLNLSALAELRIPITGPRPFDVDATRDVVFHY
jgi:hypothetical protein